MGPTALSRRKLLASAGLGVGVLALAGCSDRVDGAPADDATSPAGSADLELARRVARRVGALLDALAGAAKEHRELRAILRPLQARHREHVGAFTPDGETLRFPGLFGVPRTAEATLAALVRSERGAAVAIGNAALIARSGELAGALASAAASMAQHVVLLEAARDDERGGS